MAHFAGLVAAGFHPNPLEFAHVVTTTTHKTLRGSRGGMILSNDEELGKRINSAIFPGLQGGPLMHAIAGKAAAFGEALKPEFKVYIKDVMENAKTLANNLIEHGFNIVTGGTDTHLLLVDLRPKKITGNIAEKTLERAYITCNKNGIPFDPEKPTVTSGIRLGTPAATSRGFGTTEFAKVGDLISEILEGYVSNVSNNETIEANVNLSSQVKDYQKDEIVNNLSDELTDIEGEKLKGLAEGVGFEDTDQYKLALETIKENYFPRTTQGRSVMVDEESEVSEDGIVEDAPKSAQMTSYVNTIGRTVVEKQ